MCDVRKREVPNWLNFSLIWFALAYRAFYALFSDNISFFVFGVLGFGVFFVLAYAFYYSRVFAGGDAKLLMGFGIILPYSDFKEFINFGIIFIFFLFLLGSVYSLIYSIFIVIRRKDRFIAELRKRIRRDYWILFISLGAFILLMFFGFFNSILLFFSLFFVSFLYFYIKALDKCMIIKVSADKLGEGDWLVKDIRIGKNVIKKSVHGLNMEDIKLLKKFDREIYVKEGIPFTPAFLFALITVFFFLILKLPLLSFLLF